MEFLIPSAFFNGHCSSSAASSTAIRGKVGALKTAPPRFVPLAAWRSPRAAPAPTFGWAPSQTLTSHTKRFQPFIKLSGMHLVPSAAGPAIEVTPVACDLVPSDKQGVNYTHKQGCGQDTSSH